MAPQAGVGLAAEEIEDFEEDNLDIAAKTSKKAKKVILFLLYNVYLCYNLHYHAFACWFVLFN